MPKSYPHQVIIRAIRQSNKTLRKKALLHLAKFCNDYNKSHPPKNIAQENWHKMLATKNNRECYIINDDFDKTPPLSNLQKLGDVIVPTHVINVIFKTFHNVNNEWALKNPAIAKRFFSLPYPTEAISALGYSPQVEKEALSESLHYRSKKIKGHRIKIQQGPGVLPVHLGSTRAPQVLLCFVLYHQ